LTSSEQKELGDEVRDPRQGFIIGTRCLFQAPSVLAQGMNSLTKCVQTYFERLLRRIATVVSMRPQGCRES
jgi:hypothetical protein